MEHGWSDEEYASFNRQRLDAVFPERPVCLHRVDSHAILCNTEALERAGLWGRQVNQSELQQQVEEAGGRIETDERGEPTGLLVDAAMRPVLEAIPEPSREEDEALMERAANQLVEMGVTSVHLARVEVERLEMLRDLERSASLPMRMYALVDGMDPDLPRVLQQGPTHDQDAWLSVAGIKLFADGALGSRGALLIDGYPDGSSGLEDVGPEEMGAKSVSWMGHGWQVAIHAIGDLANRRVLDAYSLVPAEVQKQVRPRIEHAQMLADAEIARVGRENVIPSIQPVHMRSDASWAREMLTDEQRQRLFRWRDLQDVTDSPLASGSDFPIEDPNPWHGLATAMSRRDADNQTFFAEQALGRNEAIASYTTGPAYAAHWEDHLGRLTPGMCADMVAPTADPFEASPDAIWEIEPVAVWIGGEDQLEERSDP
jgi:predicted amidohydrolase YtcJ